MYNLKCGFEAVFFLTSVPVGGLVEHEHGIVHLKWRQIKAFRCRYLSGHAAYCLTSALLKFCRRLSNRWTRDGERGEGREGSCDRFL